MSVAARARRFCHTPEDLLLCKIISHLLVLDIPTVLIYVRRGAGILNNCVKKRIRQVHAVLIHEIMKPCHKTKRLSVALKMQEILLHLLCEHVHDRFPLERKLWQPPREPLSDRHLSEMPERRIPDIVDQSRTFKDMGDILFHLRGKPGISPVCKYVLPDILSQ